VAVQGEGLSFEYDEPLRTLRATFDPQPGLPAIDEAWLRQRLADEGYGDFALNEAAVAVLLTRYLGGQAVSRLAIGLAEDAVATVTLAPDSMSASLQVTPAKGGRVVDRPMIERVLAERGVRMGLLEDVIGAVIANGGCDSVVVARGKEPVPGIDGRLETLIDEAPSRVPKVDANGLADYRDLGAIPSVQVGTPLIRRIRATAGENGFTVTGLPIPAKSGKEAMFAPRLTGVQPDPNDPDVMQAAIVGQPVRVKGGIMVEPIFKVPAVTMATGNIDYDGAVIIEGDVSAGMTVKATGDIHIGGTAESAILISGGNIVIKGGAVGNLAKREQTGQIIQCKGCFSSTYVQQVRVEAGDSIFIDDVAMQSELLAINQIIVGGKNRGVLVGGQAQATLLVKAKTIGGPTHIRTRVDVGVNPQLSAQLAVLAKRKADAQGKLEQVNKVLALRSAAPAKVPEDVAAKATRAAIALRGELQEVLEEEQQVHSQMELAAGARVVVDVGVYEGAEMYCGQKFMSVDHDRHHGGSFVVDDEGNFVYDPTVLGSPEEIRSVWKRGKSG
jgi:uncharacterized protein (DUF342 family)